MFKRVRDYFRDVRINLDFPQYEKAEFLAHQKDALRRFDNSRERAQIATINQKVEKEVGYRFNQPIARLNEKIQSVESDLSTQSEMLRAFATNHNDKISSLYAHKKELYDLKDSLHDQKKSVQAHISSEHDKKNQAYSDLESAKSSIDKWYSKSRREYFGNAGIKLPKHSLFGQSHGDLEQHKNERDRAGTEIQNLKSSIYRLKTELSTIFEQIGEINAKIQHAKADILSAKTARQRMYDLKREGHSRNELQREVEHSRAKQANLTEELSTLEEKRTSYKRSKQEQYGLRDAIDNSESLEQQKIAFLRSFEEPSRIRERKRAHRKKWLEERRV